MLERQRHIVPPLDMMRVCRANADYWLVRGHGFCHCRWLRNHSLFSQPLCSFLLHSSLPGYSCSPQAQGLIWMFLLITFFFFCSFVNLKLKAQCSGQGCLLNKRRNHGVHRSTEKKKGVMCSSATSYLVGTYRLPLSTVSAMGSSRAV